jgi:hypothetical protein
VGERPNTTSNNVVITVIVIKGINTINQEIILNPRWHKIFNNIVNNIIIINFNRAVLYMWLNESMIMCVREKAKYSNAGAQKSFMFIIYIM